MEKIYFRKPGGATKKTKDIVQQIQLDKEYNGGSLVCFGSDADDVAKVFGKELEDNEYKYLRDVLENTKMSRTYLKPVKIVDITGAKKLINTINSTVFEVTTANGGAYKIEVDMAFNVLNSEFYLTKEDELGHNTEYHAQEIIQMIGTRLRK